MTINDIKAQVQLRVEDKEGNIYTNADIVKAIHTAVQKIPAMLDKQYLSRLLHEQRLNTWVDRQGLDLSSVTMFADNQFLTTYNYNYSTNSYTYLTAGLSVSSASEQIASDIWKGYFCLDDLTTHAQHNANGYELLYDQIESAYLVPNTFTNYGAKISDSIVWIHITDQLGRYELENSYMYTPSGDSPVLVRTGKTNNGIQEVQYTMLPKNLPMFGTIYLMYYRKPMAITNTSNQEPEISSVAHECIVYFASSELLASDGDTERSVNLYNRGMDIINSLNQKTSNMDATKKQSNI